MKDKLRAAIHDAAINPARHPSFALKYLRGHELSGTTQFTMTATGAYSVESNVTRDRQPFSRQGELDPRQRDSLLQLLDENDVIAIPPSTRNIADDEEPVGLDFTEGDQAYRLMIWHGDAVKYDRFRAFERGLLALLRELSNGAVLTSPDY